LSIKKIKKKVVMLLLTRMKVKTKKKIIVNQRGRLKKITKRIILQKIRFLYYIKLMPIHAKTTIPLKPDQKCGI